MSKAEYAAELLISGMSCSQSMLAAFGPDYGLDRTLAVRLGAGLGGGLGLTGNVCGAVNGACILLGLILADPDNTDKERQKMVYEATALFLKRFQERRGSTQCRDILAKEGYNVPEDWPMLREKKILADLCPGVVRDAAQCLEDVLAV